MGEPRDSRSLDESTQSRPLSRRALLRIAGFTGTAAYLTTKLASPEPVAAQVATQRRIVVDLNTAQGRQLVRGQWRVGPGLVPGEPNEGLVAGREGSPARLADYDDSDWEICDDIGERRSSGLTFAWYRITAEIPAQANGVPLTGSQVFFELIADNYGEIWVDGQLAAGGGVLGNNAPQRVRLSQSAVPGDRYIIACLAINGPLAAPGGSVFLRYANLVFEYVS